MRKLAFVLLAFFVISCDPIMCPPPPEVGVWKVYSGEETQALYVAMLHVSGNYGYSLDTTGFPTPPPVVGTWDSSNDTLRIQWDSTGAPIDTFGLLSAPNGDLRVYYQLNVGKRRFER